MVEVPRYDRISYEIYLRSLSLDLTEFPTPTRNHQLTHASETRGFLLMINVCVVFVFVSTKVANKGQQGNRALLFICVWLNYANHLPESSAMTDYWCKFSPSNRHRELNQLPAKYISLSYKWNILSTKETSNAPQLGNLLCVWLRVVFPDLVTWSGSANPVSTARGLCATQWEACMHSLTI